MDRIREKRIFRISIIIILVFLVCFIGNKHLRDNYLNPVSTSLIKFSSSIRHKLFYSDYEFDEFYDVGYSIENGHYAVRLYIPESSDNYFSLRYNHFGWLIADGYEYRVEKKYNTIERLHHEYVNAVFERLKSDSLYWDKINFSGGLYYYGEFPYIDELESDREFELEDLGWFGEKLGELSVTVYTSSKEEVTVENMAEALIHVRETLEKDALRFHSIDFELAPPSNKKGERLKVTGFLYQDIYEENLLERLNEALVRMQ